MTRHWQAIMVSNTLWIGESQPCLTYGMRGLICMDIAVSGPQRDLHSGNDGGVFNEPLVSPPRAPCITRRCSRIPAAVVRGRLDDGCWRPCVTLARSTWSMSSARWSMEGTAFSSLASMTGSKGTTKTERIST